MKLDDFLKCKKVRCVKAYSGCLTVGKEYSVLNIRMEVKVRDDEGGRYYWESDHFEPVLDSAENPLQDVELTPEFETEASEPKFEVGNKVYIPNIKNLCTIRNDEKVITSDGQYYCNLSDSHDLCFVLATHENYEMLCKLYPHIEFEQPTKELKGNDLCIAMLKGKHINIMCQVDGNETNIRIITLYTGDFFYDRSGNRYSQVIPVDTTGEPLTESILND